MTLKKTMKLIAIVSVLAIILAVAACQPTGALELKSFTVDRSSVKTNYLIGEEIDFSGIKATAKYSDQHLNKVYTATELTITYEKDITATVGEKEVTVSFTDPHLNVVQTTKVTITVTAEPVVEPELSILVQFENSDAMNKFDSANTVDPDLTPDDSNFAGQFYVGDKTYVIGNENAFRFNPQMAVFDENDAVKELENFFSVVEVFVEKNDEYVTLTATAGEGNLVSYYDGETLIVTVDTYKGLYNFSDAAAGLKVKISVLPSEEHYIFESVNPVVLEANIIKAYNIYEAWELAVVDNYNYVEEYQMHDKWTNFKLEHGLNGVEVSGIVLHNDIKVTANDVPDTFFFTSEKDVIYKNSVSGEEFTVPAGTKFLKDWIFVYERYGAEDFVFEGNFFTIDASEFPLVASPAVFDGKTMNGQEMDYGDGFSNAALFCFSTINWHNNPINPALEKVSNVTINNLSLIGNAARNNLVDEGDNLVSAGGLIFCKSSNYTNLTIDNLLGNASFTTFFIDYGATMTVSHAKCYNSYQNAVYVWGNSEFVLTNSYIDGCGGPAIIAQSFPLREGAVPNVVVTDSVVNTSLVGNEVWFEATSADTIIGQLKALGQVLEMYQLGTFVDNNMVNIMAAIMVDGVDAEEIASDINAQGKLFIDDAGIDRTQSAENLHWALIKGISEFAASQPGGMFPPFFTVYGEDGTPYTFYFNGTQLIVPMGATPDTQIPLDPTNPAFAARKAGLQR